MKHTLMVSPFSIRNVRLFILIVMTVPAFIGLADMALFLPTLVGVIPIVLISSTMYLLRFFQSHYLNRITTSDQRATVLSFKGLSMNLAYGIVGGLYSLLVGRLRSTMVLWSDTGKARRSGIHGCYGMVPMGLRRRTGGCAGICCLDVSANRCSGTAVVIFPMLYPLAWTDIRLMALPFMDTCRV